MAKRGALAALSIATPTPAARGKRVIKKAVKWQEEPGKKK